MGKWIIAVVAVFVGVAPVRAEWPARVFAPYMYVGAGDDFKLTACDDACGLKHYTLAFIIARQEGSGKNAKHLNQPSWDGRVGMGEDFYKDQIEAIRKRGGDVILSFGGEGGREPAIVEEDSENLLAAYQGIVDRYKFTWLDFDIEGSNLEKNPEASRRRNTALARLQKANPGLRISYTLPVDPKGLSAASRALLADAANQELKVYSVNLMVMYFGKQYVGKGKSEGQLGVESAETAYAQMQKIEPSMRVGLCPCLGENGSKDEVFRVADAKVIREFADRTPWVVSLHYWSINDDAGKKGTKAWAFARVFEGFK